MKGLPYSLLGVWILLMLFGHGKSMHGNAGRRTAGWGQLLTSAPGVVAKPCHCSAAPTNKPCLISRHYIANTRWTAFETCRSRCISMDCVKPAGGARLDWHSPGGLHSFSCWYTLDVPLHPSHVEAALLKQAELSRWMNSRENSLALRKLFCMGSY